MYPEAIIDRLMQNKILESVDTGDELHITPSFIQSFDRNKERIEAWNPETVTDELEITLRDKDVTALLTDPLEHEPDGVAEYLTLLEFAPEASEVERLLMLTVVDHYLHPDRPVGGVPASFLPVHCSLIRLFVKVPQKVIVYFWREDCDPCDVVRQDFDQFFEGPPRDLALFSVYGPRCSSEVVDAFQLAGAPTVLFFYNGEIDSRLVGAHYPGALESEIDFLRTRDQDMDRPGNNSANRPEA